MPYPAATPYGYAGAASLPQGLSIAALVCGLAGAVLAWWLGLLAFAASLAAVIMGHIAMSKISKAEAGGRGMALTGLIAGYIGMALSIVGFIFSMVYYASILNS